MPETIRILCVDDEVNILNVVRRQLDDEPFEVCTALTVDEGFRILQQGPPVHVVLSDYRMPGMNGVEFLREVALRWPEAVGIILSGFADIPAVKQAMESGGLFRFIPKPWKGAELHALILEASSLSMSHRAEGKDTP